MADFPSPHPGKTAPRKPSPAVLVFLMLWHGVFSGAFVVVMLSGYGAYGAHSFAGVVIIFAIGVRLLVGAAFPKGHALSFPLPSFASLGQGSNGVRRFLAHMVGVLMLAFCAAASLTGWYAWHTREAHNAVSYMTLALIGFHIVLAILMQGWKKAEALIKSKS